jgi:hypothetical protein
MLHLPDFEHQVGFNHPIVERFRKVAMKMDIDSKKLRTWHDLICAKWDMDKYDRLSKKVHISSNGGREQQAFNGNGTYHNGKKYSFFMFSVIVAAG